MASVSIYTVAGRVSLEDRGGGTVRVIVNTNNGFLFEWTAQNMDEVTGFRDALNAAVAAFRAMTGGK